jgi:hypothetical protein
MQSYSNLSDEELFGHLKETAKGSILVQDACNLSGVVHDFSRVMSLLSEISARFHKGTEWKNHHPIAVMYASKIASLTGAEVALVFSKAYEAVHKIANAASLPPDKMGWD